VKSSEFDKFVKMMALASSDSDGEALAALRGATKILVSHGYTWEMLLRRRVTIVNEVEDGGTVDSDLEVDLALRGAAGSFRDTLLSIQAQYENGGSISPRQRAVVKDAAERAVSRHPGGRFR